MYSEDLLYEQNNYAITGFINSNGALEHNIFKQIDGGCIALEHNIFKQIDGGCIDLEDRVYSKDELSELLRV